MNTRHFIAAATAFAAVASFNASAQEATPEIPVARASVLNRDAVRLEALQARKAGQVLDGERSAPAEAYGSALSRTAVKADLQQARALGLLQSGEASDGLALRARSAGLALLARKAA